MAFHFSLFGSFLPSDALPTSSSHLLFLFVVLFPPVLRVLSSFSSSVSSSPHPLPLPRTRRPAETSSFRQRLDSSNPSQNSAYLFHQSLLLTRSPISVSRLHTSGSTRILYSDRLRTGSLFRSERTFFERRALVPSVVPYHPRAQSFSSSTSSSSSRAFLLPLLSSSSSLLFFLFSSSSFYYDVLSRVVFLPSRRRLRRRFRFWTRRLCRGRFSFCSSSFLRDHHHRLDDDDVSPKTFVSSTTTTTTPHERCVRARLLLLLLLRLRLLRLLLSEKKRRRRRRSRRRSRHRRRLPS